MTSEQIRRVAPATVNVLAYRDSQRAVFAEFYRAEVKPLVRFVMKIGASEHEAADAAQTALTQAWTHWYALKQPRAWIRTVATREFWRLRQDPETPHAAIPDRAELLSPETIVVISERTKAALAMLHRLPPLQRAVLAWSADGFSNAEIAQRTGCRTEVAVRKNLQRARANLRALLAEGEGQNS
ncbi:RNA polymerase sigma factor [Kibdelosporangium phytohabitans]|uniref:RNA polymerase sigma factor n=1 Tax=Kibdelosporangium phytohabitans TaxID=860235 RepID=UPI001470714E|nr:sigma-70 family RNA polymerase sigma factor [Kibdelosporangium phytohabitans]MBE1463341.1 RNA polymerase sigma-70 factor (ECF subfamily) [Kibdelosporangium phytohabitans]